MEKARDGVCRVNVGDIVYIRDTGRYDFWVLFDIDAYTASLGMLPRTTASLLVNPEEIERACISFAGPFPRTWER